MIDNDEDLQIVQSQITRLENAIASLVRDVRPKSETRFKLMAEGDVDQIAKLRAEIDHYLSIDTFLQPQNAAHPA